MDATVDTTASQFELNADQRAIQEMTAAFAADRVAHGGFEAHRVREVGAGGRAGLKLHGQHHNTGGAGFELSAEFVTSALAVGQVRVQAQLIGSTATLTAEATGVIDRTPPTVALTRPAPGGRVCAHSDLGGNPGVRVEGRIQEAGGYAIALDWGLGTPTVGCATAV